ncbi:MAG: isoprenylcysteine carboxylmethyltransferase family protein, partial [Nitrospirota bacterium]|nr:isoprenylcysteine carboxylmethyltransferase family protein [Nitrospirota bacterium]
GISDLFWEILCLLLSFVGLAIRCLTIGYIPKSTSGRNTKKQIAEVLNTTGMYSIVRHPLYLGNFIIFLGITLFIQVWWFALIAVLAFFIYYERIIFAEEGFLRLKHGALFLEWAEKTPAFLPKFKNWQKSALPFSFKNVLKREYTAFFVITTSFPVLDSLSDLFVEGKLQLDIGWDLLFIIGLITYLVLRTLKKRSKLLDVDGR